MVRAFLARMNKRSLPVSVRLPNTLIHNADVIEQAPGRPQNEPLTLITGSVSEFI